MRTRNNPNAKIELLAEKRFIDNREGLQDILSKNKDKNIFLEIGMGKGDFISRLASLDLNNIYIGVELSISVLATAIKNKKI